MNTNLRNLAVDLRKLLDCETIDAEKVNNAIDALEALDTEIQNKREEC